MSNGRTSRDLLWRARRCGGFTLVELILVIALIMLMLAMLLPMLSRVRYQTRLTWCGSNLRQLATGALSHATDNDGDYPYRPSLYNGGKPNSFVNGLDDDRPHLAPYIDLNSVVNCPMSPEIDWDNADSLAPNVTMTSPYSMYFGWGYSATYPDEEGMLGAGDHFTWKGARFNILAGDRDVIHVGGDYAHSSHPDRDGVLWNEVIRYQSVSGFGTKLFTYSRWINYDTHLRGLIDMNYAFDDGHVERFGHVEVADERMTVIPEFANGYKYPVSGLYVPEMK